MVHYRLHLALEDGTTAFSNLLRVNVEIQQDKLLSTFPNPVKSGEEVFVNWQMKAAGNLNLQIHAFDGKTVLSRDYALSSGRSRIDFSTRDLATGLYLIQLKSANGQAQTKLQVD